MPGAEAPGASWQIKAQGTPNRAMRLSLIAQHSFVALVHAETLIENNSVCLQQFWARQERWSFVPVSRMSDAFKKSKWGLQAADLLAQPYDRSRSHPDALVHTRYALSGFQAFKANLFREVTLVKRNAFVYIFKTAQVVFWAPAEDRSPGSGCHAVREATRAYAADAEWVLVPLHRRCMSRTAVQPC